jgi:disulfide bond formation protein DsbB
MSNRRLWLLLAAGCFGLAAGSLVLTAWLDLHPCPLCIFQRLLFMVLVPIGLIAALQGCRPAGRAAAGLFLLTAAGGAAAAGYQTWLQTKPPTGIGCGPGSPGPIERLVEQLGNWAPDLFLATGLCDDPELVILSLSLANWALVAFVGCLVAAGWAVIRCMRRPGEAHGR